MLQGKRKYWLGFSLVELMAVVAVIGILVSLALPRFRVFIARGRQAEAAHNLGNIRGLQKAFHLRAQGLGLGDNVYHSDMKMGLGLGGGSGTCDPTGSGRKNDLGFRVEECTKLRYTYLTGGATNIGQAKNEANGSRFIYPNCSGGGSKDEWSITVSGNLTHDHDIVQDCDN